MFNKTITAILLAMATLTACEQIDTDALTSDSSSTKAETVKKKNVKFKVSGLDLLMEDFSQASSTAKTRASLSDASMTSLMVIDTDGTVLCSQLSTDSDFGTPNIALAYGRHELAFIATKGTNPTVSNGVWQTDAVKDTYAKYVTLDVSATTLQQTVTLDRAVAGIKVLPTDVTTAAIATAELTTASYGSALTVPSLAGRMEQDVTKAVTIPSGYFSTGGTFTTYTFTPEIGTEYTTSCIITFKDASGTVLFTHTVTDVPLLSNRVTTIKGMMFGSSAQAQISVSTDWLDTKVIGL